MYTELSMTKIGIFAGTFDPLTLGHLDIAERAKLICDHLIISVAVKPSKPSLFSLTERVQMLKMVAKDVEIVSFDGLIIDFAKEKKASFLIRGLRSFSDFEAEYQMAAANKKLGGIETIFLMADSNKGQISSSLIREIAHFKGPLHDFIPKEIEPFIRKKIS